MNLSVKARIAIAMTALVAVNTLSAGLSYVSFETAARHSRTADSAARLARDAEIASTRLTQFVADSRALGFTVSRSSVSEDSSVAYGRLQGAETDVDAALRALARDGSTDVDALTSQWVEVRDTTFLWVNREAERSSSPFRLTRDPAGRFRASIDSNIVEPARIAAMTDVELSREVRDATESLKNATLRRIVSDAEKTAAAASAAETEARSRAIVTTLVLAALGLVMAAAAAMWLYRSIALPLAEARAYADRVAGGDLAAGFPHHRADEIGTLTHAVEAMKDAVVLRIATMREMAGAVLVTAEAVREDAVAAEEPAVVAGAETLLGLAGQMLES